MLLSWVSAAKLPVSVQGGAGLRGSSPSASLAAGARAAHGGELPAAVPVPAAQVLRGVHEGEALRAAPASEREGRLTRPPLPSQTWRKYDTDHSGFIETEELKVSQAARVSSSQTQG